MRRWPIALGFAFVALAAGVIAIRGGGLPLRGSPAMRRAKSLDRYCVGCHNDPELAGGVSFESLDREELAGHADVWEAAVRKLRTGLMPPLGEPRPERAVLDAFAASLEAGLDAAWARAPNPGTRPLARLTRTEYANAIRDLLAYDASAIASTLPPDATVGGFDNNAAALGVSPTLLEGYATAAMQIGRRAVGDRTMGHGETRYTALPGAAQRAPIEGLPLGTRGGLAVEHTFPLDAEYELRRVRRDPGRGLEQPDRRARLLRRARRRRHVQRRARRRRESAAHPLARAGGPAAHHRRARRRAALRRRQRALRWREWRSAAPCRR